VSHTLPDALSGDRFGFDSRAGRLNAYVAGEGPPLLLIHSINAVASAAEVRPLFEQMRRLYTVFALDLPGFGGSDRSDRRYTPRLMTDAIHAILPHIAERCGERPVHACALSLSAEFLARAAAESPGAFRTLALVSPTGFSGSRERRGPQESTYGMPWLYSLLRGPGWGRWLYRGLTRPGVIRYFLRRTWGSRDIDEALWAYDVLCGRQEGAWHAPLYFLSAGLFSADIHSVYERLAMPVWLTHGVRGDFTDYRGTSMLKGRANWRVQVYQSGALPHFEFPDEFCRDYQQFLQVTPS
jgi:pimeloyl-ACP methyl ester carboxylesterase